jgi:hypothetical protein
MKKEVTCTSEGVYSDALVYGRKYEVLACNEEKRQVKVRGKNGRSRWYPCGCFDMAGAEAPKMTRILKYDALEKPVDWVEVDIELSDGQRRWCYFITPDLLLQQAGKLMYSTERLLSYNAPHMIVVNTLSKEGIELSLQYIQSQGELLRCTRLIEG